MILKCIQYTIIFFICIAFAACATSPSRLTDNSYHLDYSQLLPIVKRDWHGPDVTALRMAYTETEQYLSFIERERVLTEFLFKLLVSEEHQSCLEIADEILGVNYTNLNAHQAAMHCAFRAGDVYRARIHSEAFQSFIMSVGNSGDGRSPESAYVTISRTEMMTFIEYMKLEVKEHKLLRKGRKSFRLLTLVEPNSQDEFQMYFDITIQARRSEKILEQGLM